MTALGHIDEPGRLNDKLRFPVYLDPFLNPTTNSSWAMVDSGGLPERVGMAGIIRVDVAVSDRG